MISLYKKYSIVLANFAKNTLEKVKFSFKICSQIIEKNSDALWAKVTKFALMVKFFLSLLDNKIV